MKQIVFPINQSERGQKVADLHTALFYFIQENIIELHPSMRDAMMESLKIDRDQQLYGEMTGEIVLTFRIKFGLNDHRSVDQPTAEKMNALLRENGQLDEEKPFIVRGRISFGDGKPASGLRVSAYDRDLRSKKLLGEIDTDAEGKYEIRYSQDQFIDAETGAADVFIRVGDDRWAELPTSPVVFNAPREAVIDLTIPAASFGPSEYERYTITLAPSLGQVRLAELNEEDIEFLTGDTGISKEHLRLLSSAGKLSDQTDLSEESRFYLTTEVFYGWLRQDLPARLAELLAKQTSELISALQQAVERKIVSEEVGGRLEQIKNAVELTRLDESLRLAPENSPGTLGNLLATMPETLNYDAQRAVAKVANELRFDHPDFLKRLAGEGLSQAQTINVERTLRLGELAERHTPLIQALQAKAAGEDSSLQKLTELGRLEWFNLSYQHGAPIASGMSADSFANKLESEVEAQHPTAMFKARLKDGSLVFRDPELSKVSGFLEQHPQFDLIETNVEKYISETNLQEAEKQNLTGAILKIQRAKKMGATWQETGALLEAGIESPLDVVRLGNDRFREAFAGIIEPSRAEIIYAGAEAMHNTALTLMVNYLPRFGGPNTVAIPNDAKNIDTSVLKDYPTLQRLFGDQDYCACGHCQSVLSPAAYFVDLLHFLGSNQAALQALLKRRPDLVDLLLSCENTKTELPHIDLVLEILENAIGLPIEEEFSGKNIPQLLKANPLGDEIKGILRRTSISVGDDVRAVEIPTRLHSKEDSIWVVADQGRRWTLQLQEGGLYVNEIADDNGLAVYALRIIRPAPYLNLNELSDDIPREISELNAGRIASPRLKAAIESFIAPTTGADARLPLDSYIIEPAEDGELQWTLRYRRSVDLEFVTTGINLRRKDGALIEALSIYFIIRDVIYNELDLGNIPEPLKSLFPIKGKKYEITKNGNGFTLSLGGALNLSYRSDRLKATALTYQSSSTTADLLASPENRNPEAYNKLRESTFPWSLPLDLWLEEVRAFLGKAGTSRLELMQLLKPKDRLTDEAIACETLGLSKSESTLITRPATTNSQPTIWELWGLKVQNNSASIRDASIDETRTGAPLELLKQASIFLQQSRLSFGEMQDVLRTTFVGAGNVSLAPGGECQPSKIRLEGLEIAHLNRIHRFVRLWRKTSWRAHELDLVIGASGGDLTPAALKTIANFKRLQAILGLPIGVLVSWWKGFSNPVYRAHTISGQPEILPIYDRVFLNASIQNPPDSDLLLNKNRTELLSGTNKNLGEKLVYLAACLSTRREELEALIPSDEVAGELRLVNLEKLHRIISLTRALRISTKDYLSVRKLTGIDPFVDPQKAIDFCESVQFIVGSGLTIEETAYLLLHELRPDSALALADENARQILTELRNVLQAIEQGNLQASDPLENRLRAQLVQFGWNPALIDNVIQGLTGKMEIELPNDQELLDKLKFDEALDALVRRSGNRLTAADFLPDAAFGQNAPSLYTALPSTTPKYTEYKKKIDELKDLQDQLKKNTPVWLQSAQLPVHSIKLTTTPTIPQELSGKYYFNKDTTELSCRGWVRDKDVEALIKANSTQGAALNNLKVKSDQYIESNASNLLLPLGEYTALLQKPVNERLEGVMKRIVILLQRRAVAALLAQAFSLAEQIIDELLSNRLNHAQQSDLYAEFLAADFAGSDPRLPTPNSSFQKLLPILIKLQKSSLLLSRVGATSEQLRLLAPKQASTKGFIGLDFGELPTAASPADPPKLFKDWKHIVYFFKLRTALPKADQVLAGFIEAVSKTDLPAARKAIADSRQLPAVEIEKTAQELAMSGQADYRSPYILTQLLELLTWSKTNGARIADAKRLAASEPDEIAGVTARNLLRARYNAATWHEALKSTSDPLRNKQRDSLVDFLIAREGLRDAHDLYEYYLIDPLMSPCMKTTRILQATQAVQLFVLRVLLNLEDVSPKGIDRKQWEWMKNYRVWEANRKVFLFPENWLYPELRDNKSQIFRELESSLNQNEPSHENAKEALTTYLDQLNELSQVLVLGMYEDRQDNIGRILYVVGRSPNQPYRYFWRKCLNFGEIGMQWTGWERVDLDLSGDHVLPFVFEGDFHIAWPIIRKTNRNEVERWEVQIAWARHATNGWTKKKLSKGTKEFDVIVGKDENGTFSFRVKRSAVAGAEFISKETLPYNPDFAQETIIIECYYAQLADNKLSPALSPRVTSQTPIDRVRYPNLSDYPWKVSIIINARAFAQRSQEYNLLSGVSISLPLPPPFSTSAPLGVTGSDGRSLIVINSWLAFETEKEIKLRAVKNGELDEKTFRLPGSYQNYTVNLDFVFENQQDLPVVSIPEDSPLEMFLTEEFIITSNMDIWINKGNGKALPKQGETYFYASGYKEIFSRNDGAFSLTDPSNRILNETPGQYFLVKSNATNEQVRSIWSYRDDACLFYFYLASNTRANDGNIYILNDRASVSTGLLKAISLNLENLFSASTQGLTDQGKPISQDRRLDSGLRLIEGSTIEEAINFRLSLPISIYHWETFFQIPLLIASYFLKQQRFEDAQRWLHFIFNPTTSDPVDQTKPAQRFWQFRPFREADRPTSLKQLFEWLANPSNNDDAKKDFANQIALWKSNPFRPHVIARLRPSAYQWRTVFSYLENLIAWGDQLFRRDTRESINEATLLYVLAAKILGRRPQEIPQQLNSTPLAYRELAGRLDEFSNAWLSVIDNPFVKAWLGFLEMLRKQGFVTPQNGDDQIRLLTSLGTLYFCIPHNEKLAEYWNEVEDRLFKIRHCLNIEGVARELPLFDPPIDPGVLVRATAAGVDIASVLADSNAPLPHFRFNLMVQKAAELCSEAKSLGGALLSALEKKDAEHLSLLRSGQEIELLKMISRVKEQQINESDQNLQGLRRSRETVAGRYIFYQRVLGNTDIKVPEEGSVAPQASIQPRLAASGELRDNERGLGLIESERDQIARLIEVQIFNLIAGILNTTGSYLFTAASVAAAEPTGKAKDVISALGHAANLFGNAFSSIANMSGGYASRDEILARYERRRDDWLFQSNQALKELAQIDKQIAASELRKAITENELKNHNKQIENAEKTDAFMREKYTNEQLYSWMEKQIFDVYNKTYRLAFDLAKRAERAFRHELGLNDSNFIKFDYWDSLKKGLLAGEHLYHDLKRMEAAYLEQNKREYEMTKHISLLQLDPIGLIQLKESGSCTVKIPEWLFDLDYPGHYLRRLKSVSLTIPCVTGPYTSVSCTLTLLKSSIRHQPGAAGNYTKQEEDSRFTDNFGSIQSIVTSSAQNDSGMFETNLRDERYLPFEGAGAISEWRIEIPKEFPQFDHNSISDVILHFRYTARDGGEALKRKASDHLKTSIANLSGTGRLTRLFSLRHEFPNEWQQFKLNKKEITFKITKNHFPYFAKDKIAIDKMEDAFYLPDATAKITVLKAISDGWKVTVTAPEAAKEILLICYYT